MDLRVRDACVCVCVHACAAKLNRYLFLNERAVQNVR